MVVIQAILKKRLTDIETSAVSLIDLRQFPLKMKALLYCYQAVFRGYPRKDYIVVFTSSKSVERSLEGDPFDGAGVACSQLCQSAICRRHAPHISFANAGTLFRYGPDRARPLR